MKVYRRLISVFMVATMMLSFYGSSVYAAATPQYYAYSIGVNHGTTNSGLSGDFTPNVNYASICYGMISGISSYYNHQPTQSYMKSNNPSGTRIIASRVVFLNGHANQTTLVFNHNNNGGSYDTGVYYGNDTTKYVGITSQSMSGVDLISFVGCSTAKTTSTNTNNLPSRAVYKGATSAVGFTNAIHSRSTDGQGWCRKYNDALATGYTIAGSIAYASSVYPNSDLGTYAKIYGSSTNAISSGGSVSSNIDITELYNTDVEINVDNIATMNTTSANELGANYYPFIETLKEMDSTFDPHDYSVYINMFSEEENNGIIVLTYKIGNKVETNYSITAYVSNGVITSISKRFEEIPKVDEKMIIEKAERYHYTDKDREEHINSLNINADDIVSESGFYKYDYETNMLTYEKSIDYISRDNDNVTVANSFSILL